MWTHTGWGGRRWAGAQGQHRTALRVLVGGLEGGGLQDLRPWAWARRPAARTEQGGPRCRLHPLQDKSSALIFPVWVRGKGFVPLGNRGLGQVDRAPPGHTGLCARSQWRRAPVRSRESARRGPFWGAGRWALSASARSRPPASSPRQARHLAAPFRNSVPRGAALLRVALRGFRARTLASRSTQQREKAAL